MEQVVIVVVIVIVVVVVVVVIVVVIVVVVVFAFLAVRTDAQRTILVDRRCFESAVCTFLNHVTMMCGADSRTVMVAMMVNRVKMIRHILSITIAANFQSFVTFVFTSSLFS